eukprot:m.105116 g.105116  ORF g.105116 m.105116 type:complete len:687 (+) comp15781_c0_seq1:35-2095(+)
MAGPEMDERGLEKLKQDAEDALRRDRQKLMFVKEHLTKSEALTQRMMNLLNTFSDRLSSLETTIRPLHLETLSLTRARDNVKKVNDMLSEVAEHYETSLNVQSVLSQSPAYQLDQYLKALGRVQRAIQFFQTSASNEEECNSLKKTLNTGHRALETEFEQVLERHSFALSVEELLEMTDDEIEKTSILSDDVVATLRQIVEYLVSANCTPDIERAYSKVRTACVAATLNEFAESQYSTVGGGAGGAAPQTVGKATTARSAVRRSSLRKKRPVSALRRMTMPDKDEKPRSSLDLNIIDKEIENLPGAYVKGSHPILNYTRVLYRLLQREAFLITQTLSSSLQKTTMRRLLTPVMDSFFSQCELLHASAGKKIERNIYFSTLFVFDIVDYLHSQGGKLCEILQKAEGSDFVPRLNDLVLNFIELARKILTRFEYEVFNDANKRLPPDGTVHELASNTLNFLSSVNEYADIVGNVLRPQEEMGSSYQGILWVEPDLSRPIFGTWILSVLKSLRSNLTKKAQSYDDPALTCLFLMNNFDHILRTVANSPCADVVKSKSPQFESEMEKLVEAQRMQYGQATWQRCAELLVVEEHGSTLSKKEKDAIKEKYSGFNDEFERIVRTQQGYTIPNKTLREGITRDNVEFLVKQYKAFDRTYRHSGFSVKNPQKYVRYTPDDVEAHLLTLFDAAHA